MQLTKLKVATFLLVAASALYACGGFPAPPEARAATQTISVIDGVAEQTLEALRAAVETARPASPARTLTHTALPATSTAYSSATPWPAPVRIQVSVDTNCRAGPGPSFRMVGALMVGETTLIRARSNDPDYWLVENPDNPGRECWLWGRHAIIDGDTGHLPLASVPATPTPAPATLAGWVYLDANGNGVRGDPGDGVISGVELTLRVGACPGGLLVATVVSDGSGRYLIPNLIPTLYCLSRDLAQQLLPNTWSINLSPGEFRDEVNFRRVP